MDKENYIRLSIAYLVNICHEGEYLLVKNSKNDNFQPVGGCYKYFESAKQFLRDIGYIPERTENGIDVENDFRIFIPTTQYQTFKDWYNKGISRELDYFREFKEEMFDEDILPAKLFKAPKFKLVQTGSFELFTSQTLQMQTAMPMDIVTLELTKQQAQLLSKLKSKPSEKYIWATKQNILDGFIKLPSGQIKTIGNHTPKILVSTQQNFSKA